MNEVEWPLAVLRQYSGTKLGAGGCSDDEKLQVIPEGTGPVKGYGWSFFGFLRRCRVRRSQASGSRLGRSPTAERPEGLDAGAVRRSMGNGEGVVVLGLLSVWSWGALLSSLPVSRRSQPSNGLLVIPSPRRSAA